MATLAWVLMAKLAWMLMAPIDHDADTEECIVDGAGHPTAAVRTGVQHGDIHTQLHLTK